MSSLKRKGAPGGEPPAKSSKAKKESRPSKQSTKESKQSTKDGKADRKLPGQKATKSNDAPAQASIVTRLREEEPLFPRGGGSVLTPMEKREINLQARADAALEEDEFPVGKPKKVKEKKKGKKGSKKDVLEPAEEAVKVESLNYKKLVKGSLVLAQISEVAPLELVLALPNNLTGRVSIVNVSDRLTNEMQEEAEGDESDDEQESQFDLTRMFRPGQYVRASVLSTEEDAAKGKTKRKIQLSLRPEDANSGLTLDDIVPNSTLMASVVSAEDHGCVMDIGSSDSGVSGFLARKQIDSAIDQSSLQPGAAVLCLVTGKSPNGKVVQLSTLADKMGNRKSVPGEATTINTFLPGTIADVLVSDVSSHGLVGKILGHMDATADLIHSGLGPSQVDLVAQYKIGSRIRARVICNFPTSSEPKVGISLLPHVVTMKAQKSGGSAGKDPSVALPISSFVEKCTVMHVENGIGLFVELDGSDIPGFVHISRCQDGKVDALYQSSGPFQVGSEHRGRVVGYNAIDGLFHISFEQSVLDEKFLRLEDVPIGEIMPGVVERLIIDTDGLSGLIIKVTDKLSGYVDSKHFADVVLQHPEKKFREGLKVKARVLTVNFVRRQMRLTLKKTLVNSDAPVWKSLDDLTIGEQAPGTIISVKPRGAYIQFFSGLTAFLPASEMSEAFIRNPEDHFKVGQVVSVYVLSLDRESKKFVVSCKDPSTFGLEKQAALKKLQVGQLMSATIAEKSEEDISVELSEGELRAILPVGHLSDKSASKKRHALKRLRVGQVLENLMVLEKDEGRRLVFLTQKPSLLDAQKAGTLVTSLDSIREGAVLAGFVKHLAPSGAVIGFGAGVAGFLPSFRLPSDEQTKVAFGMELYGSLDVQVKSIDMETGRLSLGLAAQGASKGATGEQNKLLNPAREELSFGKITEARIASVKDSQLNVVIGEGIQGRVDISQIFDDWGKIPSRKKPLEGFQPKQTIPVRVLGIHDARNHRHLPISHRSTHAIIDLTARPSDLEAEVLEPIAMDQLTVGSEHIAFVNNVMENYLWVNLSPNVRGRILAREVSDDISQLSSLAESFPIGSALRVRVLNVDPENNRLDLTGRSAESSAEITWESLKVNTVLPGLITKLSEHQALVSLSSSMVGTIHLPDLADDFDEANMARLKLKEFVRVSVVDVDAVNKWVRLSTRPSRILSSTLPVSDREVKSVAQLSSGEIIRGFVRNISDKGLFVHLGGSVTAIVKVSNLWDRFIKEWKEEFKVGQLVTGRVVAVDAAVGHVELNLRASVTDANYVPLKTLADMKQGQVVTGTIRKVEDYGVFIVVDGSANVSGLCHRNDMADAPVQDARKLYSAGDAVKALVTKVMLDKKRIAFSLKPSLIEDGDSESEDEGGVRLEIEQDSDDEMDGVQDLSGLVADIDEDMGDADGEAGQDDDEDQVDKEDEEGDDDEPMPDVTEVKESGGKYDWAASAFPHAEDDGESTSGDEAAAKTKKRRRNPIEVDRTAELDVHGPQTASDYEKLLSVKPDSSALWTAYMAFQVTSGLPKAREVAERAVRTINVREERERLNVWVAYLNLEVTYGTESTIEEVFKRARQYNDEQEVCERLASIYILSGKHAAADALFDTTVKKFGAGSVDLWYNYAHFLHVKLNEPQRVRSLMQRASQSLGERHRIELVTRFAGLEYRSPNGNPELGRTLFEGVLSSFPKKGDIWDQLADMEMANLAAAERAKTGDSGEGKAKAKTKAAAGTANAAVVRDVFERRTRIKGLKPHSAASWFKKWADWEEKVAGAKGRDAVKDKAAAWVAAANANKHARK